MYFNVNFNMFFKLKVHLLVSELHIYHVLSHHSSHWKNVYARNCCVGVLLHCTDSYLFEILYVFNVSYNMLFEGSLQIVASVTRTFHVR